MSKPYSVMKRLGWKSGQCNTIIRETGYYCQEPATYDIHDTSGRVIGRNCPKHGKELEQLVLAANGLVSGIVGRN